MAKVLSRRALRDRSLLHQEETEAAFPSDVIAESESMKHIFRLADQVAQQPSTVLLTGESGTGKEVVARFIHRRSPRRDHAFVAVNCAAIPETLLESELFGHEKGSFTGAVQTRRGRFELADGGTLFLDEIAEMGVNLQAKFLRVLQEQQFERIGSDRTIAVDVRVIAATNKDARGCYCRKIISGRSVLPAQCVSDPHPAAARKTRGYTASGGIICPQPFNPHGQARPIAHSGSERASARL